MLDKNPYRDLPTFLYKYRSFDKEELQLKFFLDGSLYCSPPIKFNDPFDSFVKVNYSSYTDKAIVNKLERIINHLNPNLSENEIKVQAKYEFENFDKGRLLDKDLQRNILINHITNYIGVYSLSEAKNHILLWSHYAASHTGFVIEFNAVFLKNYLVNTYFPLNQKRLLLKVNYSNKYQSVNAFSESYDKELSKAFLTKAKEWSYEKEWRILYYNGANKSIIMPLEFIPDIVNSVILGSKISSIDEGKIKDILSRHNIKIKKAIQSDKKFEMIYKDIN